MRIVNNNKKTKGIDEGLVELECSWSWAGEENYN